MPPEEPAIPFTPPASHYSSPREQDRCTVQDIATHRTHDPRKDIDRDIAYTGIIETPAHSLTATSRSSDRITPLFFNAEPDAAILPTEYHSPIADHQPRAPAALYPCQLQVSNERQSAEQGNHKRVPAGSALQRALAIADKVDQSSSTYRQRTDGTTPTANQRTCRLRRRRIWSHALENRIFSEHEL